MTTKKKMKLKVPYNQQEYTIQISHKVNIIEYILNNTRLSKKYNLS